MQSSYPSDPGAPATGRRLVFALGLAIAAALTLIATLRTSPVQTQTSSQHVISNSDTAQPTEKVIALFERELGVENETAPVAVQRRATSKITPVFNDAVREELRQSVQTSINASLAKLSAELALNSLE